MAFGDLPCSLMDAFYTWVLKLLLKFGRWTAMETIDSN